MSLSCHIAICDALVRLMDPLIEIVIHDVKHDVIAYINGALSERKVGDPSLLDRSGLYDLEQAIYCKINFDGRLVKSISVVLDEQYLLCINCDISVFTNMHELTGAFLKKNDIDKPRALFINDWQEKLNSAIHSYLQEHGLLFDKLLIRDKKAIVHHLFTIGAFAEKNAADYIAKSLKVGRATIFKYLREWRKQ